MKTNGFWLFLLQPIFPSGQIDQREGLTPQKVQSSESTQFNDLIQLRNG